MKLDPTINAAMSATLEQAINSALAFDPASRQAIGELAGKSLLIEIVEPEFNLCLQFESEKVAVTSHHDKPTTRLRGNPLGLIQLALSDNISLSETGVEAWGSTSLLAELQRILSKLEVDWEDALSPYLGDVVSHTVATHIRNRANWINERGHDIKRLAQEFLTEELRATPTRSELDRFNREVDQLRLAADRLQSRFDKIKKTPPTNTTEKG